MGEPRTSVFLIALGCASVGFVTSLVDMLILQLLVQWIFCLFLFWFLVLGE